MHKYPVVMPMPQISAGLGLKAHDDMVDAATMKHQDNYHSQQAEKNIRHEGYEGDT